MFQQLQSAASLEWNVAEAELVERAHAIEAGLALEAGTTARTGVPQGAGCAKRGTEAEGSAEDERFAAIEARISARLAVHASCDGVCTERLERQCAETQAWLGQIAQRIVQRESPEVLVQDSVEQSARRVAVHESRCRVSEGTID